MIPTLGIILILSVTYLVVDTKRPALREDDPPPSRDYRPSKWIANSALDVWYGNKSMIDVFSREFNDIINKIALRPMRAAENKREWLNSTGSIYEVRSSKTHQNENETLFVS